MKGSAFSQKAEVENVRGRIKGVFQRQQNLAFLERQKIRYHEVEYFKFRRQFV